VEKAALKRARKKVQINVDRIWSFLKSQRAGSSTTPLKFSSNEDVGDDDANDEGDNQYGPLYVFIQVGE